MWHAKEPLFLNGNEHRSRFAALHLQWWRLHMSEKFSSGTKNLKQTNKQYYVHIWCILSTSKGISLFSCTLFTLKKCFLTKIVAHSPLLYLSFLWDALVVHVFINKEGRADDTSKSLNIFICLCLFERMEWNTTSLMPCTKYIVYKM